LPGLKTPSGCFAPAIAFATMKSSEVLHHRRRSHHSRNRSPLVQQLRKTEASALYAQGHTNLHLHPHDTERDAGSAGVNSKLRMGITVYYSGRLISEQTREDLLCFANKFREEKKWPRETSPNGLILYPHPDCEPVELLFENEVFLDRFTKTQFAGIKTHIQLIEFLRLIKPFFSEFKVEDDGEYWETGMREMLIHNLEDIERRLADIQQSEPHAKIKVKLPSGKIVDVLS
jgi:hypothetical protein